MDENKTDQASPTWKIRLDAYHTLLKSVNLKQNEHKSLDENCGEICAKGEQKSTDMEMESNKIIPNSHERYKQKEQLESEYLAYMKEVEKSALAGDLEAQSAFLHELFYGTTQDHVRAVRICRTILQTDPDNVWVNFYMGTAYLRAQGVACDWQKAYHHLTIPAKDPKFEIAHFNLGFACFFLRLYEETIKWLSAVPVPRAMVCVAHSYQQLEQPLEAMKYFEQAAALKSGVSCFMLGTAYLNGSHVEKNEQRAHEWLTLAAQYGHDPALLELAKLEAKKNEHVRVLKLLQTAVQKNVDGALGRMTDYYTQHKHEIIALTISMADDVERLREENTHIKLYPGTDMQRAMNDFYICAKQQH